MNITRLFALVYAVVLTAFAGSDFTLEQARERAAVLRAEISRQDELYFRKAAPEITDAQYDSLKRELRTLADKFPGLAADSSMGDDRSAAFPGYSHRVPMLSLNKSHTEAELKAFITRLNRQVGREDLMYVIEPKYDGLAISVTYENGTLVRAATRGNGTEGDDVTANLIALGELPRQLGTAAPAPAVVELRGEVYMSHAEFKRINQERVAAGEEPFAHPRNLAVGTLRQQPGSESRRRLEVVFYGIGAWLPVEHAPRSQQALHALIRAWGLPGVGEFQVAHTAAEAWAGIQSLGRRRGRLPYPIDGAVVKLADLQLQAELGASGEGPRGAIAYKYPPDRVATRVVGIVLQVGRTGLVSPVAELEAVKLGGSTVRRATLHNRAEIARKDIRIGDWVFLEKAGEIIPAITGVDLSRRPAGTVPYAFPENCPGCDTVLRTEGVAVRCPNADCAPQIQRRLEHFVSNAAMDIDGFGQATMAALVRHGWVKQPADLYALSKEQLRMVATAKATDKLLAAIAVSRRRELWRFVYGMGVPGIGPAGAKAIARRFPGLAVWASATAEDYQESGVSEAARRASLAFFAQERNREEVRALQRAIRQY